MMTFRRASAIAALAALAAPASAADGVTHYAVSGTGLDRSSYEGTATVTRGPGSCKIAWRTPSEFSGICLEYEGAMIAYYESGGQKGLILYQIQASGTLAGVWNAEGSQGLGTEILTPKSGGGGGDSGGGSKAGVGASAGAGAGAQQ